MDIIDRTGTQPFGTSGSGFRLPGFGGVALLPSAGMTDAAVTTREQHPGTLVWSPPT